MPTGITAPMFELDHEPPTFREFALRAARMLSPLVSMREEPLEAPVPDEIEPSTYHRDAAQRARRALESFEATGEAGPRAQFEADQEQARLSREQLNEEGRRTNARLDAMLAQVEAWEPPSQDHEGLKEFMVQQLSMERSDDESTSWPGWDSFEDWRDFRRGRLECDVRYHDEKWAEARERAEYATRWIRQLKASLA